MLTGLVADPLRFVGDRIYMKLTTLIVCTSAWHGADRIYMKLTTLIVCTSAWHGA